MNERFIYVFTEDDKKKMENIGCRLYKADNQNSIFIFIAKQDDILKFDNEFNHPEYILSDIIAL